MVTKLQSDDREPNAVHEQLGKHFIGRVHIPFLTIYCNARIDAYLRIETPLFSSLYKFIFSVLFNRSFVAFK